MEAVMQIDLPSHAVVVLDLQDLHVLSWLTSALWILVHMAFAAVSEPATNASVSLVCTSFMFCKSSNILICRIQYIVKNYFLFSFLYINHIEQAFCLFRIMRGLYTLHLENQKLQSEHWKYPLRLVWFGWYLQLCYKTIVCRINHFKVRYQCHWNYKIW